MNGKGSKPRPLSVSYEKYGDNYDAIFRKKTESKMSEKAKARWRKSAELEDEYVKSGIFTNGGGLIRSTKVSDERRAKKIATEPKSSKGRVFVNKDAVARVTIAEECNKCNGTGTLDKDYTLFECPWCNGKGIK